ncbi:hypothetical protein WOLCODRAFT_145616 [Wolfiporia cocos MD-104 SS10]|uniref:DUF6699 domain-containing protein n=1 Tax=Wolfiporia cocos (strain MD-104) TaxID=742152 RepID=A0A2H3J8G5_WOLCO|nr:hypothetical protein WOLCODRAFT_145616 [Wolfiporia cocos MD-104 SS10]
MAIISIRKPKLESAPQAPGSREKGCARENYDVSVPRHIAYSSRCCFLSMVSPRSRKPGKDIIMPSASVLSPPPLKKTRTIPLPTVDPSDHIAPKSASIVSNSKAERLVVHPLLAANVHGNPTRLGWDIMRDYRTNAAYDRGDLSSRQHGVSKVLLAESATMPPTSELIIRITDPTHPWRISVRVHQHSFVTVEDVLREINLHMRTRVSPQEWTATPQNLQSSVRVAFRSRCARAADPQLELNKGIRRGDFLNGTQIFGGISVPAGGRTGQENKGVILELKLSGR